MIPLIRKLMLTSMFLLIVTLEHVYSFQTTLLEPNNSTRVNFRSKRSTSSCAQNSEASKRIDCGKPRTDNGILECEAMGCCWDTSSYPLCFIGARGTFTLKHTCSFAQPKDRRDCGYPGITKSQCEAKNCCFDSRVPGANNCFYNENFAPTPSQNEEVLQRSDIERLIHSEDQAIRGLLLLKSRIQRAHRDYSIAKTVGSGASIGGTVAVVAGIFLAPFTAGLSTVLSVGGLATTIAGATTSITTTIVEYAKSQEWENELVESFAPHEEELRRNAEKIITWVDTTLVGGKVTNIAYGETARLLYPIWDDLVTPSFKNSIKYMSTAGEIKEMTIPFNFLRDQKHWLTKFVGKLGVPTAKIGATALKSVAVGLGVAGIGFDIYTIVDTWVNDPAMVAKIDKIIAYLQGMRHNLNELKNEF